MKKKFKSKTKKIKLKLIIILIIFLSAYTINKYISKYLEQLFNKDILMQYLIKSSFNNQINYNNLKNPLNINEINVFEEIKDIPPNESLSTNPLVYIYNTHDEEPYQKDLINPYNINYNVKLAAHYLTEKLNNLGLKTILETRSIKKVLTENNWLYKYSYKASRTYLEDTYNNNPSLKFFIDLHRDSSVKEKTSITINNTPYARILFIVGKEHDNYQENLKVTKSLNTMIETEYEGLSRGIYQKSGPGVNGIYNQDFNKNTILIELGGQYNTMDEVTNTINILSPILYKYIKENIL